jgi:hypothetical protein
MSYKQMLYAHSCYISTFDMWDVALRGFSELLTHATDLSNLPINIEPSLDLDAVHSVGQLQWYKYIQVSTRSKLPLTDRPSGFQHLSARLLDTCPPMSRGQYIHFFLSANYLPSVITSLLRIPILLTFNMGGNINSSYAI